MTNNLPNNPFPERKVELRIEMIDPDNFKIGAKAYIEESILTDIRIDPRDVIFKALQDIAHKIVSEAFPDTPRANTVEFPLRNKPTDFREEQNEAIADMVKLPLIQQFLNPSITKDNRGEN